MQMFTVIFKRSNNELLAFRSFKDLVNAKSWVDEVVEKKKMTVRSTIDDNFTDYSYIDYHVQVGDDADNTYYFVIYKEVLH